uniref:Probable fatty acid-binding protein n=1 Tax=Anopheles gambiae TaxID=7165 RepID=FABP_ANOGA|nr:RecName: Full=Probable fatty acid-binding protein [Anopheles gambiae]
MAVWEGKKYKMEKSEGFDDYMKALGVGMVLRKLGNSISPTVELVKNGDEYTFNTLSPSRTRRSSSSWAMEFDEETVDGRMVKSVCTFDGNKLIHEQKGEKRPRSCASSLPPI